MMQKSLTYTYILLVLLTIGGVALGSMPVSGVIVIFILSLSFLKAMLVAFQFMELKIAHSFWKYAMLLFGLIVVVTVAILLV
ncbi:MULTISPECIES: cytochrome C oxidase subunit IV family protein [Sphingobacterium]|uniref:cytochrome C oxidase subunit IV family protein n=1 Tax=Sphingobacterium TaxID=28453 RepID=UPI0013DAAE4C|nr:MULTISPECIES: cytochrome C oxidase subunit IV family protein [unclassified Sphingobacterium]